MSPATLIYVTLLTLLASVSCLELWDKVDFSECSDGELFPPQPVEAPLKVVVLAAGQTATWDELYTECYQQSPGYVLLHTDMARLTEAQKGWCGGGVVPFGVVRFGQNDTQQQLQWLVDEDGNRPLVWIDGYTLEANDSAVLLRMRVDEPYGDGRQVGALNLSNTTWWMEDEDTTHFSCAVCQLVRSLEFLVFQDSPQYFPQAIGNSLVIYKVLMSGPNDTPQPEGLKEEFGLLLNANVTGVYWFASTTTDSTLELAYHVVSTTPALCHEEHEGEVVSGYQVTRVERVDICHDDQTANRYTNETLRWRDTRFGLVASIQIDNASRVTQASRLCYYNASIGIAVWGEVSYWDSPGQRCFNPLLDQQLECMEAWVFVEKNETSTINSSFLSEFLMEITLMVLAIRNKIVGKETFGILRDMGIVMARTDFVDGEKFEYIGTGLESIGSSTLDHPFVGFTNNPDVRILTTSSIQNASYKLIRADDKFDIHQASRITAKIPNSLETTKLIFYVITTQNYAGIQYTTEEVHGSLDEDVLLQFIVTPSPNNIDKLNKKDLYFDIYLYKGQILHWVAEENDFTSETCIRTSSKNTFANVYRCSLEYVTNHLGGLYYVSFHYEPLISTSDLIKRSLWYLIPLIVESILALIGLTSIILTAIFIEKWRRERGNKILLHMTFSLTINLALSFFVTFADENTGTDPLQCNFRLNACMFLGVMRHYSYLTMFLWMLALSCLQVRRILTILGSSEDTNLIWKISAFAWGFPLIPVASLVALSRDFYKPDRRGLCYPEGWAFRITIQGPAAFVLVSNAVLYILITARIYEWCGWGKTKGLQRHVSKKKTIFTRRLMTSFCVFVIFGLIWTFHWLAEEGVFEGDVLYEYLFLSTATTHIFLLSVFFVFFDKLAKTEWKQRFKRN